MLITLLPFYSQQNKASGKFMIDKCCVSRINNFYASKLSDLGYKVTVVMPKDEQCELPYDLFSDKRLNKIKLDIPQTNLEQRLFVNIDALRQLSKEDLIISHNEIQSLAIKKLVPNAYLIQFNHLLPIGTNRWFRDLAKTSWKSADLVVVLSDLLKRWILDTELTLETNKIQVWPTVFPKIPELSNTVKDIDILFIQRCSESNYTHHLEFIEALKIMKKLGCDPRVAFTDPTKYFAQNKELLKSIEGLDVELVNADSREDYIDLLYRAKYSIALMSDDHHGGVAIRESILAGAIPILARTPAYREILQGSQSTRGLTVELDPSKMAFRIAQLLQNNRYRDDLLRRGLRDKIRKETFEEAFDAHVLPFLDTFTPRGSK